MSTYINIDDIEDGPIQHEKLPQELLDRIINFKEILIEVEKTPIDQTIENFKKDTHPESEVEVWEHIARAYHAHTTTQPDITLDKKKEIYKAIFLLSLRAIKEFEEMETLSEEEKQEIVFIYVKCK
jgi:hypothetical protein